MATPRPNIVFLFPDQLRRDFLRCYGAEFIQTPHMDSIAEEGVRYDRCYSASPVCVPARISLLTGLNALKNGVTDNSPSLRLDYREAGIQIWPEMLAERGYYTAAVGKMHFYPWDARFGFQYRVIAEDKRWLEIRDDYYHFLKERGLRKLHGEEHEGYHENKGAIVSRIPWEASWDHFVGMEACRFIRNYGTEGPFALMVGFPGPHCPYDPTPEFLKEFDPADMPSPIPEVPGDAPGMRAKTVEGNKGPWNGVDYTDFPLEAKMKIRAHYAALVKQIDYEVGQILDALREQGLLDNTVVIFASDHGDYLGDHNLIGKNSFYESATRVPLLIMPPGLDAPAVEGGLVELTDVTSTMLHFAGYDTPAYMDSRPLPGLGIGEGQARERIFGMLSDGWMAFDGRWKLAKYASGEVHLFDLEDDPHEQRNLAADPRHSETLQKLDAEMTAEIMESVLFAMRDRLPAPVGLSADRAFAMEGWTRPFPHRFDFP
ncbi:MAG: sulfatase-like hydrolase/transferase, partial [Chloroflexi bacterium]|nr:sulfatase-like hydrolase/transferase [Chloroflexota bacterium]